MTILTYHWLMQKKTAKDKITSGVINFLQQKAIKPSSNRNAASSSLKCKVKTSKKKSSKKAKLTKNKFKL